MPVYGEPELDNSDDARANWRPFVRIAAIVVLWEAYHLASTCSDWYPCSPLRYLCVRGNHEADGEIVLVAREGDVYDDGDETFTLSGYFGFNGVSPSQGQQNRVREFSRSGLLLFRDDMIGQIVARVEEDYAPTLTNGSSRDLDEGRLLSDAPALEVTNPEVFVCADTDEGGMLQVCEFESLTTFLHAGGSRAWTQRSNRSDVKNGLETRFRVEALAGESGGYGSNEIE